MAFSGVALVHHSKKILIIRVFVLVILYFFTAILFLIAREQLKHSAPHGYNCAFLCVSKMFTSLWFLGVKICMTATNRQQPFREFTYIIRSNGINDYGIAAKHLSHTKATQWTVLKYTYQSIS